MKYLFYLILLFQLSQVHASDTLRLTTLNIRRSGIDTGEVRWEKRKSLLKAYIIDSKPDIFCIQEALLPQVNFIDSLLDYEYIGSARDDGKTSGEYCAIFYRSKKYKVLESGTFWLSQTSTTPSSGWDAACNRICTWTLIKTRSGRQFYTFNTHLDHVGVQARVNAMRLITGKLNLLETQMPAVLAGDMNDLAGSRTINVIEDFFVEANSKAIDPDNKDKSTFNGFDKNYQRNGKKIDYIFLNDHWKVVSYRINDSKVDNSFVSDHFAVESVLLFNDTNTVKSD